MQKQKHKMKKQIITTLILTSAISYVGAADFINNLSVETLGAIKHTGITKGEDYGVGVGVNYSFNKYVTGTVRALSYSNNDWRDSVVDEGFVGVIARVLGNKSVSLNVIAGGDYSFTSQNWGLSAGLRPEFKLSENISLFIESRIQFMEDGKNLVSGAGVNFSF